MDDEEIDADEVFQRAAWLVARTLDDLGRMTARWLEGEIRFCPSSGNVGPDLETAMLVPLLAAVNRAGFVTDWSQPGVKKGTWWQRAVIGGYVDEDALDSLAAAIRGTDLVMLSQSPGATSLIQVPVSLDGDREHTWAGVTLDAPEIAYAHGYALDGEAVSTLFESWQVTVFDPAWGRNDLLWQRVATAFAVPDSALPVEPPEDPFRG